MARSRSRETEQFWRDTLRRWKLSGLSVSEFCRRHHLSPPSLYAWRRTLAHRDRPATLPRAEPTLTFVPVHITTEANAMASATAPLEVVVAGRIVRIAPGFDPATLRSLVAVLEASPC